MININKSLYKTKLYTINRGANNIFSKLPLTIDTTIILLSLLLPLILFYFLQNDSYLFFCNDYIDKYICQFKNPHSPIMVGILIVYNYIQVFLLFGLLLVIIWLEESLRSSGIYNLSKYYFKKEYISTKFKRLFLKNNIGSRVRDGDLKIAHAPQLEFVWTIVPVFLLIFIAWPSFVLLYSIEESINPLYNITVTGSQWFWTYEYNDFNLHLILSKLINENKYFQILSDMRESTQTKLNDFLASDNISQDQKNFFLENFKKINYSSSSILGLFLEDIDRHLSFDSNLIIEDSLPLGYPRLLSTDNVLVLPSETPIRFLITSNDVIHSWSVPNFGIKVDAVPGRLNQAFLNTDYCGTSWGQCSELCGVNHGYMPIEIRVLPIDEFLFFIKLKAGEILQENNLFKQVITKVSEQERELLKLIKLTINLEKNN